MCRSRSDPISVTCRNKAFDLRASIKKTPRLPIQDDGQSLRRSALCRINTGIIILQLNMWPKTDPISSTCHNKAFALRTSIKRHLLLRAYLAVSRMIDDLYRDQHSAASTLGSPFYSLGKKQGMTCISGNHYGISPFPEIQGKQ